MQVSVPESVQATSFEGAASVPTSEKNPVVAAQILEYVLTMQNFRKMVKQRKRFKAQLKIFANQFESTVDKRIQASIEPFLTLHGCIDDIKHRVNER